MGLNLSNMKSYAERRAAMKKFIKTVDPKKTPKAVGWIFCEVINNWHDALVEGHPEAANFEGLLADNTKLLQPIHDRLLDKMGLTVRHYTDPSLIGDRAAAMLGKKPNADEEPSAEGRMTKGDLTSRVVENITRARQQAA